MRNDIKKAIKFYSYWQPHLRKHRKTVNFEGERPLEIDDIKNTVILDSWDATTKHQEYRRKLRHLHVLYDLVRGKLYWNDGKIFTNEGNEFSFKKAEFSPYYLEKLSKEFETDVEAS